MFRMERIGLLKPKGISVITLLMICIFVIAFSFIIYAVYVTVFTGEEYTVDDKIVDAWYTGESIMLNQIDHWWVTIEFEDGIPTMYFFSSDNVFFDNGKQKADNAWKQIEPLIGSNVILEYYVESDLNGLNYFKEIKE